MRELNEMTAVELMQKASDIDAYLDSITWKDEETYSELCLVCVELNARCKEAGIKTNPDGTFYIPEFTGNADEMKERAALINYFTHKQ